MITARAPGKLYLAGEYGVLRQGGTAVLTAVDRYVTVEVVTDDRSDDGSDTGSIRSAVIGGTLRWDRARDTGRGRPHGSADRPAGTPLPGAEHGLVTERDVPAALPVLSAIAAVEQVAAAHGRTLVGHHLSIRSELDAVDGRKLGLGSSAAVTVAVVRALGQLYGLATDDDAVLRLALAAQVRHDVSGSGGDLAAATYGGRVHYRAPDRARVAHLLEVHRAAALDMEWPGLEVVRLPLASTIELSVGWTGTPASSRTLVARALARTDPALQDEFGARSDAAADALAAALTDDDTSGAIRATREARDALRGYGASAGVAIETPELEALADAAALASGAGKSSGAGGGDCGIALTPAGQDLGPMLHAWRAAGIEPLTLATAGATTTNSTTAPSSTTAKGATPAPTTAEENR
ncbi:phosphomevalonate kinase [Paraoerskovia sediminicola]|uniref:phosphomevalonate kinase n=1 Tax=Paraoerskovia sediminicola TaxID=1138587 RepID=A0ABN6XFD6_9CELL|nr:phosphomevalonate kinase [Paraoerskovia sediminicola]BDZ43564.1 phosphomevalonate kinase [Paraoerskovia sediminicola]